MHSPLQEWEGLDEPLSEDALRVMADLICQWLASAKLDTEVHQLLGKYCGPETAMEEIASAIFSLVLAGSVVVEVNDEDGDCSIGIQAVPAPRRVPLVESEQELTELLERFQGVCPQAAARIMSECAN